MNTTQTVLLLCLLASATIVEIHCSPKLSATAAANENDENNSEQQRQQHQAELESLFVNDNDGPMPLFERVRNPIDDTFEQFLTKYRQFGGKLRQVRNEEDYYKEIEFCLHCFKNEVYSRQCLSCFNGASLDAAAAAKRQKPSSKYWYSRAGK